MRYTNTLKNFLLGVFLLVIGFVFSSQTALAGPDFIQTWSCGYNQDTAWCIDQGSWYCSDNAVEVGSISCGNEYCGPDYNCEQVYEYPSPPYGYPTPECIPHACDAPEPVCTYPDGSAETTGSDGCGNICGRGINCDYDFYQYPTPPYGYEYEYPSPYDYEYEYEYPTPGYPTPEYSYEYQYQYEYEYEYPTPPPTYTYEYPTPPPPFNYSLSNSGNSSVMKTGGNAYTQNTITKTLIAGNTESVSLSLSGVPAGTSYSLANGTCSPTCSTTITFTVGPSAPVGTHSIIVTGSPLSKTTSFSLIISANPITVTCAAFPNPAILGETITWSANISGGAAPYTYSWSGTGIPTSPAPSTNPFSLAYSTVGQKNAVLTVIDDNDIESNCAAGTLQINFNPEFEEF